MRSQIDASVNSFRQTLDQYVGQGSAFSELLTPGDSNQLLSAIREAVNDFVAAERTQILSQFSLDNKDGALSRLVGELAAKNEALTGEVKGVSAVSCAF